MERSTDALSPLTTQSLLEHAREGSNSAWKVILFRYRMTLMVAAYRYLGSRHDAEDIVQAVFLSAVSALENFKYQDEGSFRRYLVTTVTHKCCDFRRKLSPYTSADLSDVPQPSSLTHDSQQLAVVAAALDKLPEPLREVLLLKRYESKSWREVCEVMGESESTVRRKHAKAVNRLRCLLS